MARGRMISKDISLDEKVDALSDDTARLLFTWMIPHLDCEGRMYGDALVFKSIVVPRRNYSIRKIEKYLNEMEKLSLIERYLVNGNQYIFAPHFDKHQSGLRKDKEAPSHIPPPTPDLGRSNSRQSRPEVKEKFKLKNNIYIGYPEFPNIKISKEEHEKLIGLFSEAGTKDRVENLSLYIASRGDKYKSHYATILSWDKRDKKEAGIGAHRGHPETPGTDRLKDSIGRPLD